jgi:pantothenate kinase
VIRPEQGLVLVEGNYLLVDAAPWDRLARFFDRTLMLAVPEPVLRRRLVDRWLAHGLGQEAAVARAEGNDLANAALVVGTSRPADVVWNGVG